ncbi:MAG: ATP-binding protein [Moraxella sp.]|nr:ATP-binding protein [Moraxella sp.]
MQSQKKRLPIGIQTFSELRKDNAYYYVDKTKKIIELINVSKYIFLSRPRRFGKSLTIDTIAELFLGNQSLFKGLYAEHNWDWEYTYPVLRISFGIGVSSKSISFMTYLSEILSSIEERYSIDNHQYSMGIRFEKIIRHCYQTSGKKVVILIDEYDKPILDNLSHQDKAISVRNEMRDFYSVIKNNDAYIHFAMLTGVSRFSKINLFSGLNNLYDVTLDDRFSALCGYTQDELEHVFAPELFDVDLDKLKTWYNGYNWTGDSVYNPFDVLLFLSNPQKLYKNYWIETGSATFLMDKLLNEQFNIQQAIGRLIDNQQLSQFEIGDISTTALLFQAGYLTIDKMILRPSLRFTLKFPNLEVQQSLSESLLLKYISCANDDMLLKQGQLYEAVLAHNLPAIQEIITAFFASIPHHWHRNNPIASYEGYWASVFYALFASLGLRTITEDATNFGTIDMTLIVDGENNKHYVYIFEFKVIDKDNNQDNDTPQGIALAQIKNKRYADKYLTANNIVHEIGIEFHKETRATLFDIATNHQEQKTP